jgi:RNase P/RNase MRP subunit POP5
VGLQVVWAALGTVYGELSTECFALRTERWRVRLSPGVLRTERQSEVLRQMRVLKPFAKLLPIGS